MIEVIEGSTEGRILRILLEAYPITIREIQREMRTTPRVVELALRGLERRGVLVIEGTGKDRFITLLRTDILFHGGRKKRMPKPPLPKSDEGPMYG
ncbi:MAG: hypothetical protein AB1665_05305 [Candidatus Thermoplasmatota archaeon]